MALVWLNGNVGHFGKGHFGPGQLNQRQFGKIAWQEAIL